MFTGLVEGTARVVSLERRERGARLSLAVALDAVELGESIAVDGVCLTVTGHRADGFDADVSAETLAVTTLGGLAPGAAVNYERSLRVGERLGGHLVLGHVDGVGRVRAVEPVGEARRVVIEAPSALMPMLAPKGSVAIDGVSLTVNRVEAGAFEVMIVPHTQAVTTIGGWASGARVNLEIDVLARYVARQLEAAGVTPSGDARLLQSLKEGGFLP